MNETITRRLSEKNIKAWGVPSLFLIDGGKGQLDAAIKARDGYGLDIPMIGLAKREEQIVIHHTKSNVRLDKTVLAELKGHFMSTDMYTLVNVPHDSHIIKLLQRIRDESHRFAVSYHTTLKRAGQTRSLLDDAPGVGPITRKKLIRAFGSARAVKSASLEELEQHVGKKRAVDLYQYLRQS